MEASSTATQGIIRYRRPSSRYVVRVVTDLTSLIASKWIARIKPKD